MTNFLEKLTIAQLVSLHNYEIPGTKPVKTFKDKPTAIARIQKLLEASDLVVVTEENGSPTTAPAPKVNPGLARLRKSEKAEAIRQETCADGDAARAKIRADMPAEAPVQPKTREVGRDALGPKPEITEVVVRRDERRIKTLAANPKREGTASHARFALYADGQTVDEYVAACVAAGYKSRDARADVKWDSEHGYITLTEK